MAASIADTELDDDGDFAETHEINVTPFIDVILVLLIIFMVAAPLSTVDLPIDLPPSGARRLAAWAPPARPAAWECNAAKETGQADLCQHQVRSGAGDRRNPGQTG